MKISEMANTEFEQKAWAFWETCGQRSEWLNGANDETAKQLLHMATSGETCINDTLWNMVWDNYVARRTILVIQGLLADPTESM